MTPVQLCPTVLLIAVFICMVDAGDTTCFNSTVHEASSEYADVTLFQGAETVTCEEGFGCSKTLISKGGHLVGVSRGCGLFGCIGKTCFHLHGHRMCIYCCRKPNCNSAAALTSELTVLSLSLIGGWLIRKH